MQTVGFDGKEISVLEALQMIVEGRTLFDVHYRNFAKAAIQEIEHLRSLAGAVSHGPGVADIKQAGGRSFTSEGS